MIRNVLSVIVGYALWTAIFLGGAAGVRAVRAEHIDEAGLTSDVLTLVMFLLLSVVASFAAGCAAYLIAQSNRMICVWILGLCLLATGIPVQLSVWDSLPVWYNLAFLILLIPVTWLGARLVATRHSTDTNASHQAG